MKLVRIAQGIVMHDPKFYASIIVALLIAKFSSLIGSFLYLMFWLLVEIRDELRKSNKTNKRAPYPTFKHTK